MSERLSDEYRVADGIAEIVLNCPPVNALTLNMLKLIVSSERGCKRSKRQFAR